MKTKSLLILTILVILITCGGNLDDRKAIRREYGDPDEIRTVGTDPFWSQFWYYYELEIAFEFRRTAPRCGGDRDVYLYAQYRISGEELQRYP